MSSKEAKRLKNQFSKVVGRQTECAKCNNMGFMLKNGKICDEVKCRITTYGYQHEDLKPYLKAFDKEYGIMSSLQLNDIVSEGREIYKDEKYIELDE